MKRKMQEYDTLKFEIERLQQEIGSQKKGVKGVIEYEE